MIMIIILCGYGHGMDEVQRAAYHSIVIGDKA